MMEVNLYMRKCVVKYSYGLQLYKTNLAFKEHAKIETTDKN